MKKTNETGTDFGNTHNNVPKSKYQFSKIKDFHNEQEFELCEIKYPSATREILKQLLVLVNSEAEYKLLLKELADLDEIIASQSLQMKGGAAQQFKMEEIVTIKGEPVIEIYESFDGSYWFITEKCHKQDSVIDGKVYKDDQILFGYAKLSMCPEFAEFGYVSETELRLLGNRIWKVPRRNWPLCPEVKVQEIADNACVKSATGREEFSSRSSTSCSIVCKEVNEKMDIEMQQKLDSYLDLLDEIKEKTGDEETARVLLGEIAKDLRMEQIQQERSFNGSAPATENQIGYLKRLGAEIPEGLTKQQASKLIDTTLAGRNHAKGVMEAPMRIP